MKIPSSNYIGTPEKWVRFLQEWARRKQVDIDASSRQGFSFPGYLDTFPFEAPASLKHFMAAYEFLGKPKLLEVAEISGHFFEILNSTL